MKHRFALYTLPAIAATLLTAACTGHHAPFGDGATSHGQQSSDALAFEGRAMALYATDKSRALQIVDSAVLAGSLGRERADLLRAKIYSRTFDHPLLDSSIVISERLLATAPAKSDLSLRSGILEELVYATRQIEDYESQLVYSTQLAEAYLQQDNKVEALRTEAEVGAVLYRLGKTEEGLSKMDDAILALTRVRRFNELDASIIAMKRKVGVIRDYPQIAAEAQLMLQRLEDYEQHPSEFSDGSLREPSADERPEYIAFYRAQAWAYLSAAYAHLGELQKSRSYLKMASQSNFGHTLAGKKMMAPTMRLLGEYEQMEAIYNELESTFMEAGDTLTLDYAQLLLDRAKAAEARGRMSESTSLWERHAQVVQKAEERLLRSKAGLYAARYHAQEQQMAISLQQAKLARANLISIFLATGLVVMLAVMLFILRQHHNLRKKNNVLAHEISEAIALRDKYELMMTSEQAPEKLEEEPEDLLGLTDAELFEHIRNVVIRDELFLNPALDRQSLCNRFSLTKEQIGSAFTKGSPYKSVTDFINDRRLHYAAKLLIERPELSVSEVAHKSGFSRADTLTSNFKRRYTMTPSQYRAEQR